MMCIHREGRRNRQKHPLYNQPDHTLQLPQQSTCTKVFAHVPRSKAKPLPQDPLVALLAPQVVHRPPAHDDEVMGEVLE